VNRKAYCDAFGDSSSDLIDISKLQDKLKKKTQWNERVVARTLFASDRHPSLRIRHYRSRLNPWTCIEYFPLGSSRGSTHLGIDKCIDDDLGNVI